MIGYTRVRPLVKLLGHNHSPLVQLRSMALISPLETHQYTKDTLSVSDVAKNPVDQFHKWFKQAQDAKIELPEALNLATAELPSGRVHVRTVLMKEVDSDGKMVIYSNWEHSTKAKDLQTNQHVAVNFWWKELERCVRMEGTAQRMSQEESQAYFQSRPKGSQIGAWASHQSQPVDSRETLEKKYAEIANSAADKEVLKCPLFWGGVRITPTRWEFWQGRASRVHDRVEYVAQENGEWKIQRINP